MKFIRVQDSKTDGHTDRYVAVDRIRHIYITYWDRLDEYGICFELDYGIDVYKRLMFREDAKTELKELLVKINS